MVITPLEIEGHEFRKKMMGCDPEEVKAFLGLVAVEFEKLVVANSKMQEEVTELRERLGELRERERMLKETMLTAQKLSVEMKEESARARAALIKEGELKAEQIIGHAQKRVGELESMISDLKVERDAFETSLKTMLEQHLRLIDMRQEGEDVAARLRFMRTRKQAASAGGTESAPAE